MISRRLTKAQKTEILEAYRAGENKDVLAEKYNCSPNTINRTVKNLLSDNEYTLLKEKRLKSRSKKNELINQDFPRQKQNLSSKELDNILSMKLENDEDFDDESLSGSQNIQTSKINNEPDNNFEEIAPLISSFGFELEKQKLNLKMLDDEKLPESVYMLVDKKVELDYQPISELPEWDFLPDNELQRKAILLFTNQRSAKRNCSRNQRVIKIPNTSVFKLSRSYLISRGITRLILEDSIIALDHSLN